MKKYYKNDKYFPYLDYLDDKKIPKKFRIALKTYLKNNELDCYINALNEDEDYIDYFLNTEEKNTKDPEIIAFRTAFNLWKAKKLDDEVIFNKHKADIYDIIALTINTEAYFGLRYDLLGEYK